MIDDYLDSKYAEQSDDYYAQRLGEYHSSATGQCPRRRYFSWINNTRPDQSAWPHFELGHHIEDIFERALQEEHGFRHVVNGIPIEVQDPQHEFTIVGETDPIVLAPNLSIEKLWEVKSTSNLKYVRQEPKREHLYQVHCYMMGLEHYEANIVYINKTDLTTVTHTVDFDPEIAADVFTRCRIVHRAIETDTPPEPMTDPADHDYFCEAEECCKELV